MAASTAQDIETRWWHNEGDKVVCTLCPRECHIPESSRGFCFVRANEGGRLVLTTYGRSSGFCIDPIEKKPLNHFLPGTPILSFGTAGCNLGCKFCQNWDISKSREMDRLADQASPEAIIGAAKRSGCRSIAFTYNDPVIWAEYAIEISKIARAEGIKTVAVTAGYISPEPRIEFYKWMDATNVDLKAFTETFYRKLTQTHLEPVLDTLRYLKHETDVWFEITTLLIPGENDSSEEVTQMCDWILKNIGDQVPLHFTAFHPDFKMTDKPPTPHETLIRARQQALDAGLKYVYAGNVDDLQRQSTYCPNCNAMVIERNWYELGRYNLANNRCGACGHEIPGVFERRPGDWGRKRVPMTIGKSQPTVTLAPRSQPDNTARLTATQGETHRQTDELKDYSPAAATVPVIEPQTDFDAAQVKSILAYARVVAEAAVRGEQPRKMLPPMIDKAPAYGLFVTLRRGAQLRACRGRWGSEKAHTLGSLLTTVAAEAACQDGRFASIHEKELARLGIDVSLMFNPQPMRARGEDRIEGIEVGRHGLVITHPRGRGLLLPHVPTDAGWDAKAYLDALCRKATLPPDTWRRDNAAQIMTFEARKITGAAQRSELDPMKFSGQRLQKLLQGANDMMAERFDPADADDMLSQAFDEQLVLHVETECGLTSTAVGTGQSPLQLAAAAVESLRQLCVSKGRPSARIIRQALLWQAIPLSAADYPDRHRHLANHAVLGRRDGPWSLVMPQRGRQLDRVGAVLAKLRISPEDWQMNDKIRLTAFSTIVTEVRQRSDEINAPDRPSARPPARAGQFYPADPDEMNREIDRYLAAGNDPPAEKALRRAVMLPHAGWVFCGETLGKTLARVRVPDTAIIIGPKHTPYGEQWSVTPDDAWDIPGARVPVATQLAKRLVDRVPMLRADPEAHRMEHGSEVIIPFLYRINPKLRVLPITIGQADYESTSPLAEAIADICSDCDDKPMLVISSDMNHFAPEPENRRLDHMAIDAMCTGEPRKLYDICLRHDISMCGFIPACIIMQALLRLDPQLRPELVDYSNSANASGDTSRVVGYAGVLLD